MSASIHEGVIVSDQWAWQTTREFYQKNKPVLAFTIAITIASAFVGLFFAGLPGVIVGLVLGAISSLLGPRAVTKVREIKSGH